jgi:protein-tyrosine phosphatase
MRPILFTIERSGPGWLCTMARPRGGDWLVDEMRALRQAGIDVVVSLLTDQEAAELGLAAEAEAATAAGIRFHRLPTPDRHAPDRIATVRLATTLHELLQQHAAGIAVHCRNGIGRASTVAAAVLLLDGLDPTDAWDRIATARGLAVPDTAAQHEFINRLFLHS